MTSALENLCGPGKPLKAEPPHVGAGGVAVLAKCHEIRNLGEYGGDLNADERIVTDLIKACSAVAAKVNELPPIVAR